MAYRPSHSKLPCWIAISVTIRRPSISKNEKDLMNMIRKKLLRNIFSVDIFTILF